ncbi:hypothetical protein AKJ59_00710 [candidate division MSBL1 archaeon SCGC-AAA385M02]|uniref:Uncharacterized protein n=1 Tax=candidate division MSBL1 archaeon SCGC-AAA385M02 TaxID=1698287 RepID=A0A133VQ80_9EURY|nr:hypothetical protein AKJ59_00710 [candidate division MSBL1 archaeon SCGC-AAA385M02]
MSIDISAKIGKLQRFVRNNQALADIPIGKINGRPVSPRDALNMLQRNQSVQQVLGTLQRAGLDPVEDWGLAEAYYRGLLEKPGPKPKIYCIGQEMTIEEALTHIRRRDREGRELLDSYRGLKQELARRLR